MVIYLVKVIGCVRHVRDKGGRRLRSSDKLAGLGLKKMSNCREDPLGELCKFFEAPWGFVSKRSTEPAVSRVFSSLALHK